MSLPRGLRAEQDERDVVVTSDIANDIVINAIRGSLTFYVADEAFDTGIRGGVHYTEMLVNMPSFAPAEPDWSYLEIKKDPFIPSLWASLCVGAVVSAIVVPCTYLVAVIVERALI